MHTHYGMRNVEWGLSPEHKRRPLVLVLVALIACLFALVACDTGGSSLSVLSPTSTVEIVPGSTGVGKPPGALFLRYELKQPGRVMAMLEGPITATLLQEELGAGPHALRFNGVVQRPSKDGEGSLYGDGVVRSVVPDGEYRIVLDAGGEREVLPFKVRGSDVDPPEIESIVLRPDTISPNSDAVDDVAELTFRTDQTATLSIYLTGGDGQVTRVLAPDERAAGEQNVAISGQTPTGEVLADGTYTVTVRAQDRAGNRVEAYRPLVIEGGGEPQIEVVRVEIGPEQIILGESIHVSITVKNVGNVPLRTHGPDPGYTYTTNDTYASIEGGKWTDKAGLWRAGADWDGNSGGAGAYRYPFRWGFGKTLMPGEEVTTGGSIVILKQEQKMWFYAGVLQEGVRIVRDRLGRTPIEVDF